MKTISIHPTLNPFAFKTAREYRGYTKTYLSKNVVGLSSKSITEFENGSLNSISLDKLKESMIILDFPFSFLYSNIKPCGKTTLKLR